ncbi:MAG: hypothetical protein JRI36_06955 [Deltaproteobacteria bacterium]|nr:hypothetical protein [Deltaproteobacteria bacterium]
MIRESYKNTARFFWAGRVLMVVVGLVFVAAALVKSSDMELFVRQIRAYGIVVDRPLVVIGAWVLVAMELGLGAALMTGFRPRGMLCATTVLLLFFFGITGWAWFSGTADECGCFGAWFERTPGQAAVEDLVLVAATLLAWACLGDVRGARTSWKKWTVVAATVAGLALPAAFGLPPVSENARSSVEFSSGNLGHFAIEGVDPLALHTGTYLVVIMGTGCEHCRASVPQINALADTPGLPPIIALCMDDEPARTRFVQEFGASFRLGKISEDVFWRLLGDAEMPRTLLTRNGRIERSWDGKIPEAEAIAHAVAQPHHLGNGRPS